MPFEPAPKTEEEQRVQLGRIALEAIAANTERIPDSAWRFTTWLREVPCGTVGCAIGNSINLPEVAACGLRLLRDAVSTSQFVPAFECKTREDAIGAAFGIPRSDAAYLFGGDGWPGQRVTQQQVADRIREYLAA